MLVLAGDLLKKDPLLLPYYTFHNETVSVGNIAVSLHTLLRGGVLLTTQYSTCHVLPKFQFFWGEEGILDYSKLKSAKSWPNFNFSSGGILDYSKNSKCQVLAKFQFLFSWGMIFLTTQSSKSQVLAKFQFSRGWYSWLLKTQSPKFRPTFHFCGEGILDYSRICILGKMNQKFWKPNLLLHRR